MMELEHEIKVLGFKLHLLFNFSMELSDGIIVEIRKQVGRVRNLKFEIFSNEHNPPHFHVKSDDNSINASFEIETCKILNGEAGGKDLRLIQKFHSDNKETLIRVWNEMRPSDGQAGKLN